MSKWSTLCITCQNDKRLDNACQNDHSFDNTCQNDQSFDNTCQNDQRFVLHVKMIKG